MLHSAQPKRSNSTGRGSTYRLGSFGTGSSDVSGQPQPQYLQQQQLLPRAAVNRNSQQEPHPTAHSSDTFSSSSPKTMFTSRRFAGGYDPNDAYRDDHPAILDHTSDDDEPDQDLGHGYMGNSSKQRLSAPLALLGVVLGLVIAYVKVSALTAQ